MGDALYQVGYVGGNSKGAGKEAHREHALQGACPTGHCHNHAASVVLTGDGAYVWAVRRMRELVTTEIARERDLVQQWIVEAMCAAALCVETVERNLVCVETEKQAWEA